MSRKHADVTLGLLRQQVGNDQEVQEVARSAMEVVRRWVNPVSGGAERKNGLIYGLVQSGKTGVLTVIAAMGADEGYRTLIILTSDNDPLYEQTRGRIQEALPAVDVLGKVDLRNQQSFAHRIKTNTCAIVVTKNGHLLANLIDNFRRSNVPGLPCLFIDDEADQASLNTRASKDDGTQSRVNEQIETIRSFFQKSTYLQVTATPGALFLQPGAHAFRPQFTILSSPGRDYVGGDDFFALPSSADLIRDFPITDLNQLAAANQPVPGAQIPHSLLRALDTFMVGATCKRMEQPDQKTAFLCHVSTRKADHDHIEDLLRSYKSTLSSQLKRRDQALIARLRTAYDDLAQTSESVTKAQFESILADIEFFAAGIQVKLVNGETDEDVSLHAPYNLFVGGNKLGRGVTIKNLLVSYYGRNPQKPNSDTVLQHARMFGYRRRDIGLLRLWVPRALLETFRAITEMERSLRDLIGRSPDEDFRGIFLRGDLRPTRRNVLVPGTIYAYIGGNSYNPQQVLRTDSTAEATKLIDDRLEKIRDKQYLAISLHELNEILLLTKSDPSFDEHLWVADALTEAVLQCAQLLNQNDAYVYVDRSRDLRESRRETQGVLSGGEAGAVPSDKVTLFMLRTAPYGPNRAAWWPQIRFPDGRYAVAFSP